jgi:hypothetical protein
MTGEEWDTRWWVIFNDLMADVPDDEDSSDAAFPASLIADRECATQFGPRPEGVAS